MGLELLNHQNTQLLESESIGPKLNANVVCLPNGLTVIHQEMATPAVVVDVWVKAGASKEPAEWSGMAHFLEHMVFKGRDVATDAAIPR